MKPTNKELHQYLDAISQQIHGENFNDLTPEAQYTVRLSFHSRRRSGEFDQEFHDQLLSYFRTQYRGF